jgi:integrase
MALTKRAKVLEDFEFNDLLDWIDRNSRMPERDKLIFLLSFKAGLRAAEIAKLDMDALTAAGGQLSHQIIIDKAVGKKGRPREIPMHPNIADATLRFRRRYPGATFIALGNANPEDRMTANALTVYMWRVMRAAGFDNCSSHSGRRTFGTKLARRANEFNNSLRDVQRLMGHARMETTESYVDTTLETFSMVASL